MWPNSFSYDCRSFAFLLLWVSSSFSAQLSTGILPLVGLHLQILFKDSILPVILPVIYVANTVPWITVSIFTFAYNICKRSFKYLCSQIYSKLAFTYILYFSGWKNETNMKVGPLEVWFFFFLIWVSKRIQQLNNLLAQLQETGELF